MSKQTSLRPLKRIVVPESKKIALVAHDGMKDELFAWVGNHLEDLKKHNLCGTGTTATVIHNEFGLPMKIFRSGPLGGDQQIGASIAENEIDMMIFFWDPMAAQPHDPDVKALLRIAVLYDVPVAMSPSSASFLFESTMLNHSYSKYIINPEANVALRADKFDGDEE